MIDTATHWLNTLAMYATYGAIVWVIYAASRDQ